MNTPPEVMATPPVFGASQTWDDPVGLGIGQRPEQQGVDDAEDRGVCADAEGEREDGHGCEAGRFGELPQGETEVVHQGESESESEGGREGGE